MRIFIAGVSCVGKTTIGARLADLLDYRFFDLDVEIERFYKTSIERLRLSYLTAHDFRIAASQALKHILGLKDSSDSVISLPPTGLMGGYWKVVKNTPDATIVALHDTPDNILKRVTFYDIDSHPIQRDLTDHEKSLYLREIKRDIAYFRRPFQRAPVSVDIADCGPDEASRKIKDVLMLVPSQDQSEASEQPLGRDRADRAGALPEIDGAHHRRLETPRPVDGPKSSLERHPLDSSDSCRHSGSRFVPSTHRPDRTAASRGRRRLLPVEHHEPGRALPGSRFRRRSSQ
jgi:shikimate kinase